MGHSVDFRPARREDVPLILRFIRGLADYEKLLDQVVADQATLEEWLFDREKAEVIFALAEGREVGFALFFHNFSTFLAGRGSTWRICLSCRSTGAGGLERPF